MGCKNIFKEKDIWVVSHIIIPYNLATLGVTSPLFTMLMVYVWESFEFAIRDCSDDTDGSNWSEPEPQHNTMISDPLMGTCGILVAVLLKQSFEITQIKRDSFIKSVFYLLLNISPTFLFFDVFVENELHHIFPFACIFILYVSNKGDEPIGLYEFLSYFFVLIVHFTVTLSNKWSLLSAFLISFVFIFSNIFYNYNKIYTNLYEKIYNYNY
jgi:hypothetical protein